jgi:Adenylate and Guanylate cyclase catalytic domain
MQELATRLEAQLGQVREMMYLDTCTMRSEMHLLFLTCHDFHQGTADLALRIGLNSGSTTAGVLRGEKSRFQLFGDVSCAIVCTKSIELQ